MNCQDTVDALHLYIDRELSTSELAQVDMHLHECPDCKKFFVFKREVKRLVHHCCEAAEPPARLRESVLQMSQAWRHGSTGPEHGS